MATIRAPAGVGLHKAMIVPAVFRSGLSGRVGQYSEFFVKFRSVEIHFDGWNIITREFACQEFIFCRDLGAKRKS
jgi:hypothetical protein